MTGPTGFDLTFMERAVLADPTPPLLLDPGFKKNPLFFMRKLVYQNGREINMSEGFLNRLIEKLFSTQVFSLIHPYPNVQKPDKFIDLYLTVGENINSNQGRVMGQVGAAALTFGLSTLVVKGKLDMMSEFTVQMRRSDGLERNYVARSAATVHYGSWSNTVLAGSELGSAVTTSNLESISNQIKRDSAFYDF